MHSTALSSHKYSLTNKNFYKCREGQPSYRLMQLMQLPWESLKKIQACWDSNPDSWSSQGGTPDFKWQGWSKDFLNMKFSILGFFWEGKFWQVLFWVAWFKKGFFWVFQTIWRFVIVPAYPGRIVPLEIFTALKFSMGFLGGLNFGPGIFLGYWFLPPFNHPCHLKSEVAHLGWSLN